MNIIKLVILPLIAFAFGTVMFIFWLPQLATSNSPIVTGTIVDRQPITQFAIPRVDFTIEIADPQATVHAYAQRSLMNKIPDQVQFRYSGNPSDEVFLFEHTQNPLIPAIICWTTAIVMVAVGYFSKRLRQKAQAIAANSDIA